MIDALKHTIYAGLGATVVTAEKLEAALQDLVKKGKISAEEAQATARKVADDSKQEFHEAQSTLQSMFEDFLARSPVVPKKDFESLKKRVEALEEQLAAEDS
jgi:polyhydroxyalkanoate synthesis regulator phasin